MNTKRSVVKVDGGKGYDIFSCPSNDYQGMVQISVDSKASNAANVAVYHNAYTSKQEGAKIIVQPGASTVVLASRVIIDSASKDGHTMVAFEVLGVFPKT